MVVTITGKGNNPDGCCCLWLFVLVDGFFQAGEAGDGTGRDMYIVKDTSSWRPKAEDSLETGDTLDGSEIRRENHLGC